MLSIFFNGYYYFIPRFQNCLKIFFYFRPLYTMTVMYYSKIVLRHLIQTYLAIQWVQLHMKHKLTPEKVITFFLQWIDPTRIYDLDEIENRVRRTKEILNCHLTISQIT